MKSRIFTVICFLLVSSGSYAGSTTAKIKEIFFHAGNEKVLFNVDVPNFGSCASSGRYAVSLSSEQGKAMVSAILAAKMAGKRLRIVAGGNCSIHPDSEDVSYFSIID